MKKRPMVLIFTGVLSGMAVVWNILSMTTAFYLLAGLCLIAGMLCQDRRYGWIMAGMIVGILFAVFARISMNLDLSQVKDHANKYTTGTVVEVSQTKTESRHCFLKMKCWKAKFFCIQQMIKK